MSALNQKNNQPTQNSEALRSDELESSEGGENQSQEDSGSGEDPEVIIEESLDLLKYKYAKYGQAIK